MHILLISRCPPYPLHLGDRLILYHLARELSQRGYVLDLLAFDDRPDIPDEPEAYAAFFRRVKIIPAPQRTQASILRRLLQAGSRFPQRAEDAWSPSMWHDIRHRLEETSYDLAHLFGGVQVYEYRNTLESLKTIITPYESYSLYLRRMVNAPHATLIQRLSSYLQFQIARRYERFMFAPYCRTVVVSEPDKAELLRHNPALNVSVIPNGIDLEQFQPHHSERETATLLFTGNFEYAPNVDAAFYLANTLMPAVRAQLPEAKLWLVGNAPPPELRALAGDHILVTGRVPDVRPYLQQATAFVSPLRLGAGIKNKVLEALALGCPVVATPLSVDGIAVQHERDALISELNALPDAVLRLLRDEALRRQLSTNGRALIEAQYTWKRVAEMYAALYQTVIDQVQC